MNIACDARALVGARTGVGTWTERVMGGLARNGCGPVHLLALQTHRARRGRGASRSASRRGAATALPWTGVAQHHCPEDRLRAEGADVWIGSLAILPMRCPVPAVAMVHDLTPRTHPARHTLANRLVFGLFPRTFSGSAHTVVVGSAATESEVLAAFPWVESKLERIGYGVDEWFSPDSSEDAGKTTRDRFTCGRPYVLHLGTIEPRKGIVESRRCVGAASGTTPRCARISSLRAGPGGRPEPIFRSHRIVAVGRSNPLAGLCQPRRCSRSVAPRRGLCVGVGSRGFRAAARRGRQLRNAIGGQRHPRPARSRWRCGDLLSGQRSAGAREGPRRSDETRHRGRAPRTSMPSSSESPLGAGRRGLGSAPRADCRRITRIAPLRG